MPPDLKPTDGQRALDNSVSIPASPTRSRIGVDMEVGEIVIFDVTDKGKYDGYIQSWQQLTQSMKDALIDCGLINEQGRIILRNVRGEIIGHGKNVIEEE